MKIQAPHTTRRELLEVERLMRYGKPALRIVVQHRAGVSKRTGEVRFKRVEETYLVETPQPGTVRLVKEDGAAYTVMAWNCDCQAAQFGGGECKHRAAVEEEGLLAASTQGA